MLARMIHAYFCTFSVYGFWPPNDPRGSGSQFVGSKSLLPYGRATKVHTRRSVAHRKCDPIVRRLAKSALRYPPVQLTGIQALWIGRAFAQVLETAGCAAYACAILPDHIHLVLARPTYPIERLVNRLKGGASRGLQERSIHPFQSEDLLRGRLPQMWGQNDWTVFLNNRDEILDRVDYVERNPLKEGARRERPPSLNDS